MDTLREIAARFNVSINAIAYGLKQMKISCKKRVFGTKKERSISKKRRHYLKRLCQALLDCKPIVYLDETGFESCSYRLHGRAKEGKRVYDYHPSGHDYYRTSLVGAYYK